MPVSGWLERMVRSFVSILSLRIAQLNKSRMRGVVKSLERAVYLRMRASLLIASHLQRSRDWSAIRHLVLCLDPVAAGLWPHLRRRKGLSLRQRLARFLAKRANPLEGEALSSEDIHLVDHVLRGLQQ